MKSVSVLVSATIAALVLQGCSNGTVTPDQKVDSEVAGEAAIQTRSELRAETTGLIQTSPGLTQDQRQQLSTLLAVTRVQTDAMRIESFRLRSVLVKDLMDKNYPENEVELIKKRIRVLADKRLDVTFDAVESANKILGRDVGMSRKPIIDEFFEDRGDHGRE